MSVQKKIRQSQHEATDAVSDSIRAELQADPKPCRPLHDFARGTKMGLYSDYMPFPCFGVPILVP